MHYTILTAIYLEGLMESSPHDSWSCRLSTSSIVILGRYVVLALHISDVVIKPNVHLYNCGQGIGNIKLIG